MANYHLTYTQAPLPFQGQKRFFVQQFARQVAQYPSDSTFVDLFGGSGLLSRVCKDIHPSARVLYNDHDHYSDRLALIPQTETIRQRLLPLVAHVPRSKRIDPATAHRICNVLHACQQDGLLIDFTTISTWLLYTMHYCDSIDALSGRSLYNSIPTTPIAPARDYLAGLEVRHADYRHLITEFGNDSKVIYLADPPYLATNTNQYQTGWRLEDTLELLGHLNGKQVIYFTSARGDLVPILEWAESTLNARNPFSRATKHLRRNTTNANNHYTDIMYVVR